jgi:NodT family efflux transporter outer membrane factor (OMF) lipoprotein
MRRLLAAALVTSIAGCAELPLAPLPVVAVASVYREAPIGWNNTAVDSALIQQSWWTMFHDDELDALQQQLLVNSPDLASALARYQQARATADLLRADQSPTVATSISAQRDRQSDRRPLRGATSSGYYNSGQLGFSFDYEVDLWGRVRQAVSAGLAEQRAASADLAMARLSLQAQLADSLLALRGIDQESLVLNRTIDVYERAEKLIGSRHQGGLSSGFDLAQAQNQLEFTRSQSRQLLAQRAVFEHAIAALVGANPSSFTIMPRVVTADIPVIPLGLPSMLLQRRPDIAAAQYRVVAASARVGVAKTAFFPSLTLSADAGLQSSDLSKFVQMPNLFWAVGPTLALDLLDGGRRQANIDSAEAVLVEAGQRYRGVVLATFQQVEDQLALLSHYGAAAQAEGRAAAASQRALDLAYARYQQGAASYLEVVTVQTANLTARRSELDLTTRQRRAAVQLVRALGGGWATEQG